MKTKKGYVNEGRVLFGLLCCSHHNCDLCPYHNRGCSNNLAIDTSRYILELERRLLDYEEKENQP